MLAIFIALVDISLVRDITAASKPPCFDYKAQASAGVVVDTEALRHVELCGK